MYLTTRKNQTFYMPALLCSILLQLCWTATVFCADDTSVFSLDNDSVTVFQPGFYVDESFSSHLPVIVLEFNDSEGGAFAMRAALSLYFNPTGGETLIKSPQAVLNVLMREEPGQNMPGKKSYSLELLSGDSYVQEVSLAGLPADSRWRLQGSTRDKGMLRNGIAYALGRKLFPHTTPDTRYCEILFRVNGQYKYQGLYILGQNSGQLFGAQDMGGEERPDARFVLKYFPGRDKSRQDSRQRDEDAIVLGRSLRDRGFGVVYPEDGSAGGDGRFEIEIDRVETVLNSLKPGTFLRYTSLLDQKSAVDLYILNALMLNAHEENIPFLLAKLEDGPLSFMPVWNFDGAIDNVSVRHRPLPYENATDALVPPSILARRIPVWRQLENGGDIRNLRHYPVFRILDADHFLWFDRLFLSRPFLLGLFSRYHELRRGPLSPENVSAVVDNLAAHLGSALERDWQRWKSEYTATVGPYFLEPFIDQDGETHIRQTASYDQELVKIRYSLLQQDGFLMAEIAQLDWISADLFDEATSGNTRGAYALATIVAFLSLTYMLTRKL